MKLSWRSRVAVGGGAVAILLGLCGCETARFYRQAVVGQCRLLLARHAISDVIRDPATSPRLRAQLEQVVALRGFAETHLHLPANGHYVSYVQLDRAHVVWNVYAAPEFSMDPKSWWYPFVGRLDYRGYFREDDARVYAQGLAREGYDVHVAGVDAYSTLGWFKDPVLSTFVASPKSELAELLFHELAHIQLFAHGDTDFNEAFATAVAREGVRRWLTASGDADGWLKYRAACDREEIFVELVLRARQDLEQA